MAVAVLALTLEHADPLAVAALLAGIVFVAWVLWERWRAGR